MFLSELLPPERVHVCLLLDQAWPLKGENQPSEYSPGRRGRTRLNWDHIYQLAWPIPLVTRRCDLKLPSTHAQILSRLLEPAPGPVFLLGIHLCGVLSIRAIETFNRGPKCVGFVLKPCCLPSMHYARQQVSWTLGSHTFAAAEVCCWGRYRQNRWTGPVKATLGPRFRCWAEHLHRGIPWTSKAISRVELVEGHYQDTYLFAWRPYSTEPPLPLVATPEAKAFEAAQHILAEAEPHDAWRGDAIELGSCIVRDADRSYRSWTPPPIAMGDGLQPNSDGLHLVASCCGELHQVYRHVRH
ncbi:Uncharacterized protein SCF082_LOCUS36461 [Durusdinium trenchii]|uniref:Uncharacterized protein n=1 Tax=Durusdinium trenchii TaxID=1381693 RepID=A0ABP0PK93_9DINO